MILLHSLLKFRLHIIFCVLKTMRNRCAFAIDYFNSKDRINDYAKFIIWLGTYFSAKEEVILCDESGNHSLVMSRGISVDDIVKVLE